MLAEGLKGVVCEKKLKRRMVKHIKPIPILLLFMSPAVLNLLTSSTIKTVGLMGWNFVIGSLNK